jgi:Nucleotidyl transferase AbiEii toxin, Type IV TA system
MFCTMAGTHFFAGNAHARYSESVDRDEIIRVLRAFETKGLEYVLIGATAMGFHGLVRATEDVDLFIRATPENVERLRQALRSAYAGDPHIDDIRAEDLLGEYPAVRYYPPDADLFFDIMTRLGEAARFESVEAEVIEFEGIHVSVATPRALYRLKKGTVRPLDRQDAAALRDRFNLRDED